MLKQKSETLSSRPKRSEVEGSLDYARDDKRVDGCICKSCSCNHAIKIFSSSLSVLTRTNSARKFFSPGTSMPTLFALKYHARCLRKVTIEFSPYCNTCKRAWSRTVWIRSFRLMANGSLLTEGIPRLRSFCSLRSG